MYPYNTPSGSSESQPGSYPPPPNYSYNDPYQGYYSPQPPRPRVGSEVWRVIGWILLIWFVGALLIGHHGLLWLLIVLGAIFYFSRRARYEGWRRWHYYGKAHYYPRHRAHYSTSQYYYPPAEQPGYYAYPPQPTQPASGNSSWPTPGNPSETTPKQ